VLAVSAQQLIISHSPPLYAWASCEADAELTGTKSAAIFQVEGKQGPQSCATLCMSDELQHGNEKRNGPSQNRVWVGLEKKSPAEQMQFLSVWGFDWGEKPDAHRIGAKASRTMNLANQRAQLLVPVLRVIKTMYGRWRSLN